jgi:glycosyltransferase involved in cell wall biosynthesis
VKILVVSQYYPPENVPIPAAVPRYLSEHGHTVRVLTGYPNYPEGRVFPGYRQRWRSHQVEDGIDILRVPLFTDHSQRAGARFLNYVLFGLSAASAGWAVRGADVIYVYATQMTPALGPWLWRVTGGAPYVLHVQDLWPDSVSGSSLVGSPGARRTVESLLNPWLASVYRRAAAVVGIAPTMVRTLVERGVAQDKVHLVYNWAEENGPAKDKDVPSLSDPCTTRVLYAGNVGDMQNLEVAVRAAHQARDAGVQLTIVGDGVALPKVRALAASLGADNVEFHGRMTADRVGEFHRQSDFALVSLKDLPVFRGTIPSKLQTALQQGVPVITTVQGDLRAIVEEFDLGFTADADSPAALEAAFRAAAACTAVERSALGERAKSVYHTQFSRASALSSIEAILVEAGTRG